MMSCAEKKKNFEYISLLCLLEKQKVAEAAQGICTIHGKNVFYILKDGYFDTDNLQHSEKLPGFDKNFLNFIIHMQEIIIVLKRSQRICTGPGMARGPYPVRQHEGKQDGRIRIIFIMGCAVRKNTWAGPTKKLSGPN